MYSTSTPYFMVKGTRYILVFKTNIRFKKDFEIVESILKKYPFILNWNVDKDDKDKVLRIESKTHQTSEIIAAIIQGGYICEEIID